MNRLMVIAVIVCLLCLAPAAGAQGWEKYRSEDFGFEMLIPPGATGVAKDLGAGWGGFYFKASDVTHAFGLAKLGKAETAQDMRSFAAEVTKIPQKYWKAVPFGSAKNVDGFKWLESYYVESGNDLLMAVIGVGQRGSYVIYVGTTKTEYKANEKEFDKFFKSIKVF